MVAAKHAAGHAIYHVINSITDAPGACYCLLDLSSPVIYIKSYYIGESDHTRPDLVGGACRITSAKTHAGFAHPLLNLAQPGLSRLMFCSGSGIWDISTS